MVKPLLEVELKVSGITHKKKTKGGVTEYKYGALVVHSPALASYIGKTVKIRVSKGKE